MAASAHCRSSMVTSTAWLGLTCSKAARKTSIAAIRCSGELRSDSTSGAVSSGGSEAASARSNGPHGVTWSSSSAAAAAAIRRCPAAIRPTAARSVDLPMPAGPSTRTTPPVPQATASTSSRRTASSLSRPRTARIHSLFIQPEQPQGLARRRPPQVPVPRHEVRDACRTRRADQPTGRRPHCRKPPPEDPPDQADKERTRSSVPCGARRPSCTTARSTGLS